ncbi:MAG TPA: calcium-translocating P-type ATPase, PMCA-type [Candidatus Alistipes merdipullorum]|nr:calcium-translocating P-type ATPase, PMCA-type [Candidatus Alistipes merdipullorum]
MTNPQPLTGLTDAEVVESRRLHGDNVLTPPAKEPLWRKFLAKLTDPLIIILLVAAALSIGIAFYEYFGLGHDATAFLEPVGILLAVVLATGLAFIFETKADREFDILNKVNDDEPVRVIRNGQSQQIPKRDVVAGDVVMIGTGDEIPADGTLIDAVALMVDESSLTGEPACAKTTDSRDFDPEATFPSNRVMRGTKVMEGHGVFRAEAVGDRTENGKVFQAAQIDNSIKTPLDEQLERLGSLITKLGYAVAALVVVGRLGIYFSNEPFEWISFITYLLQTVMLAVTLLVVSVPEGLPMAVTLSLAYSMRRMLKTNNLVRKLHACETMGATTVICTDKTGTLTQNRMRVASMQFYPVEGFTQQQCDALVREGMAVNSTASLDLSRKDDPQPIGNPTEGALLLWLHDNGCDYLELKRRAGRVAELPFSTERKYMATAVVSAAEAGRRILYVKGAPEILLTMCDMPQQQREGIRTTLAEYQNQAMRTLAFAFRPLADGEQGITPEGISGRLAMLGIAAISDPVREEVPAAVTECRNAGIEVKIVTGDTTATAREIGRRIGLWSDNTDTDRNIITGPEFEALDERQLADRVMDLKIIARARPMDKKRLVEALQAHNQVVAVTGDGTNDAPALKAANVGLSMGDGTSVAKEASDITIIDNSFGSIARAVMWGRSLYLNIQRFILFQLTVNVAACLTVLFGAFTGTESPLTVTQMLWVNLILDTFAAMALASLPPSPQVMNAKPRDRSAFIITSHMKRRIISTGGLFFLLMMALLYLFRHADVESLLQPWHLDFSSPGHISPYELSLFFTLFVMLQFWNLFNARAFGTGRSAFHMAHCDGFVFIALLILVGQYLIVTFGGTMFSVVPLKAADWGIVIAATSAVLWVGELRRLIFPRREAVA